MTVDTKELVTTVSYLIGVKKIHLENNYREECGEILDSLSEDRDATAIRYLCKLRTAMLQKFKKTDQALQFELKNIDTLEWFDADEIHTLEEWGIPVLHANYRADRYMIDFCRLISENIDKCSKLFYDWVNWSYIRELFVVPKYAKPGVLKREFSKYMDNFTLYPFNMYIYWQPEDQGNILYNDGKFLSIIYAQHKDVFTDRSKYRDAHDEITSNIYQFIDGSARTAIAVDCENSDVFKLYSVLNRMNKDELEKIEKITLYDDPHTTPGWDYLEEFTPIPVVHKEIERVTDRKSLVDVALAMDVSKDYYNEGISSFIIVSSDSDYWQVISSLPQAKFLVMYEYDKCGSAIKRALSEHGIYYCAIDDFCTASTDKLIKAVLFDELEKYLPNLCGLNARELTDRLYEDTHIHATEREREVFYERYVKTLKLKLDHEGNFFIEIQQ